MEEKLIDRIGDEYLNPNFQDGQILLNSDVNEIVSIVKEGINANFNDIQKIQNGSHQVGNSKQLDGADLSRFSDGEMVGSDKLIPTSQQVKSYVDGKVQEIKDTTEVGKLVEDLNALSINVENKVDKKDLVNEETTGEDKAYNCDYINELFENGVGDSLPIGTIVEYDGNNIPDGFEEVVEPENATVYVGPNEPTDGQDVWIQKSVNMLNKNNPLIVHAYPDGNTKSWLFDNNGYSFVVGIESNSEYTITKPSGTNIFNISTSTSMPTSGGSATNLVDGTNNEIHIRSGANDKYLIGYFAWSGEVIDVTSLLNGIQVQKGNIATPYEPYIDKKIFVKNNNGTYDEFYKERSYEYCDVILLSDKTLSFSGTQWEKLNIPFDGVYGAEGNLTLAENGIKIGKGISKVRLTLSINTLAGMDNDMALQFTKNGAGFAAKTLYLKSYHIFTDTFVVNVQEGDVIGVLVQNTWAKNFDIKMKGAAYPATHLLVEKVG